MSPELKPPAATLSGEMSSLVRVLGSVDERLELLTAGEIDSVVDHEGRSYLLRHAQDRLRRADASREAAILDALPAQVALLDSSGYIVSVNSTWRRFAAKDSSQDARCGIGMYYPAILNSKCNHDADTSRTLAEGLHAVLSGRTKSFATEFDWHSPDEDRWFLLHVIALEGERTGCAVAMQVDITEPKRHKEDLRRFASGLDATADAICLVDRSSMEFIHVNDAACQLNDKTREQLNALGPAAMVGVSRAELERDYDALIADGEPSSLEIQHYRSSGPPLWVEVRRHAHRFGNRWTIVVLIRDITERRRAEARIHQLNRLYAVLSGINSLIVRTRDLEQLFREACRLAVEVGHFSMAWIGAINPQTLEGEVVASCGCDSLYLQKIEFTQREGLACSSRPPSRALRLAQPVICNDVLADESLRIVRDELAVMGHQSLGCFPLGVANDPRAVFSLFASEPGIFDESEMQLLNEMCGDISFAMDHIAKQNQLSYLAYYDDLTGLANRRLFCDRVQQHLLGKPDQPREFVIVVIDLERFKNINHSLGRPAGDRLLQLVAEWLKQYVGDPALLARVGADQFAVMSQQPMEKIRLTDLLDKAIKAFNAHKFDLNGAPYRIAARIGVALVPTDGVDAELLLTRAEAALKEAKGSDQRYMFYSKSMTVAVVGKLKLETQLRQALENDEFVLHYQPKWDLATRQMTGMEALVRWANPRTGLVAPNRFIPILEESGLIIEVGRWVLRKALEDHLRWRAAGLTAVRVAVNVSPLQLRHRDFVADLARVVGQSAEAATGLELEITESVIMENASNSVTNLRAIRRLGVRVAIDDFGTGFSSLSYLSRLPLDSLKIDRSFVSSMTTAPEGVTLVSTIINLAHSLGLSVVAEGVESEEQSRLLLSLKCNEVQGFLFGRPEPRDIFEAKYLTAAACA